jgi:nucleotide-binding universal stress UspA family protein
MNKILVPVDGSDQSCKAARWAAQMGDSVTLLHVYVMDGPTTMGLAHRSKEEILAVEESHAAPIFESARVAMGDIEPEDTIIATGSAGQEIVFHARDGGFDHIIVGSRGLSKLRELLLGSVSEHVLHHAHCPVTVVR